MTPRTTASPPQSRRSRSLLTALAALLLLLPATCPADSFLDQALTFETSRDDTSLLLGYGQSFPGWGRTTERAKTIDFIPGYNHVMVDGLGSGWLTGRFSTVIELPLHLVVSPDRSAMIALDFLARYTLTGDERWRPYLFGGGGPVYNFADIEGMEDGWNGNYQFGLGLEHDLPGTGRSLLVEVRYHHISNGGRAEPNVPLNSLKILLGLTF